MNKPDNHLEEMRRKAEAKILPDNPDNNALKNASEVNVWKLVHELRVHQVELEMQNEELLRAHSELEESRKKFSDLYDFAPVGYLAFDINGRILESNLTAAVQLDQQRNSLINSSFYDYIAHDDRDIFYIHLRNVFKDETGTTCEIRLTGKEGSRFYAQLHSIPVQDLNGRASCRTSVSDITERKRAEEELGDFRDSLKLMVEERTEELTKTNEQLREEISEHRETERKLTDSQRQLRDLAGHLQFVREEERSKIAREIHDELGQAMTALKMDLAWLNRQLGKDNKELSEKTNSMYRLTDMTIRNVQRLLSELRPGMLDHLGLSAAIEWQAKEFHERMDIKCEVMINFEGAEIGKDSSTAIFRIFQETLTNIARHAGATKVNVNLKMKSDNLILTVRNNGKAITKEQIHNNRSFGLLGMRERVRFLQGKLSIKGIKGQGTIVTATFPLEGIKS